MRTEGAIHPAGAPRRLAVLVTCPASYGQTDGRGVSLRVKNDAVANFLPHAVLSMYVPEECCCEQASYMWVLGEKKQAYLRAQPSLGGCIRGALKCAMLRLTKARCELPLACARLCLPS